MAEEMPKEAMAVVTLLAAPEQMRLGFGRGTARTGTEARNMALPGAQEHTVKFRRGVQGAVHPSVQDRMFPS